MKFGDRIKALRISRRLSIADLAGSARIPCATLADIESNVHFPRIRELERLLGALNTSFPELESRPTHWIHEEEEINPP